MSDAQHLPTDSADASGQRNFGLYANQPQDLLQAGGRDGYRSSSGGQEKGHALSQAHRLGSQYTVEQHLEFFDFHNAYILSVQI